jgi:SAM-dependent methyltransferase
VRPPTEYFGLLRSTLRSCGVLGTIATIVKPRLASTQRFRQRVAGGKGFEIGGPSVFFRTFLPIYDCLLSLDNCVFGQTTIWEGEITPAFVYHPAKTAGRNYVTEGADLSQFADGSYDFVLSCHSLEHIANPVKALKEWMRVVRPGGSIILVLPDGRRTFDHRRSPTPVDHMLEDYHTDVGEDDRTHLEEILAKHDLRRDPNAGGYEKFRQRSLENLEFRGLHHHVFNTENSRELLQAVGLRVEVVETALPHHLALLAAKPE